MKKEYLDFRMPHPKDVVSLDFETNTLNMYEPTAKVVSVAISKYINGEIKSWYVDDPAKIKSLLKKLEKEQAPLLVYNYSFEALVMLTQYPDIKLNFQVDLLRLVQQEATQWTEKSFSLKVAVRKLLPEKYHGYENKLKDWIKQNILYTDVYGNKKSPNEDTWGRFINRAPDELLKEYNTIDTIVPILIYEKLWNKWLIEERKGLQDDEGYTLEEMSFDHIIYLKKCERLAKAKIRGIKIDIYGLLCAFHSTKNKIIKNKKDFYKQHAKGIEEVQKRKVRALLREKMKKLKSDAGRARWTLEFATKHIAEKDPFKITSGKQLAMLFVNVYKQEPKFFTETNQPSFKADFLHQWKGAEILQEKGKLNQAFKQIRNIIYLSYKTGVFHPDIKAAGTVTGRLAGGKDGV